MVSQDLQKFDIPDTPGIYFFIGNNKKILYIGKATSLKNRVRSYFTPEVIVTRGRLIVDMVALSKTVEYQQTDSVLEALILEAHLIKKHQPHYNTKEKDNKSFNYVIVTKEEFPRVLLIRGRTLETAFPTEEIRYIFGPFPHGLLLQEAVKIVRKIFGWRGKECIPASDQIKNNPGVPPHPCFNRQIGLCPGVCTGEISTSDYARIILNIKLFFEGKKKELIKKLEKEMKVHAKVQEFEKAERVKRTLFALKHIRDVSLLKAEKQITNPDRERIRIEAYDIAHLAGTSVVGTMIVVEDGEAKKSDYRKFKIRRNPGVDDTGALREVLERRFNHPEWPFPNIILVDGSTAQINAATAVLAMRNLAIPVIGVVKNSKHQPERIVGDTMLIENHKTEIVRANNEAHRFTIAYHRNKRSKIR